MRVSRAYPNILFRCASLARDLALELVCHASRYAEQIKDDNRNFRPSESQNQGARRGGLPDPGAAAFLPHRFMKSCQLHTERRGDVADSLSRFKFHLSRK